VNKYIRQTKSKIRGKKELLSNTEIKNSHNDQLDFIPYSKSTVNTKKKTINALYIY